MNELPIRLERFMLIAIEFDIGFKLLCKASHSALQHEAEIVIASGVHCKERTSEL